MESAPVSPEVVARLRASMSPNARATLDRLTGEYHSVRICLRTASGAEWEALDDVAQVLLRDIRRLDPVSSLQHRLDLQAELEG